MFIIIKIQQNKKEIGLFCRIFIIEVTLNDKKSKLFILR